MSTHGEPWRREDCEVQISRIVRADGMSQVLYQVRHIPSNGVFNSVHGDRVEAELLAETDALLASGHPAPAEKELAARREAIAVRLRWQDARDWEATQGGSGPA